MPCLSHYVGKVSESQLQGCSSGDEQRARPLMSHLRGGRRQRQNEKKPQMHYKQTRSIYGTLFGESGTGRLGVGSVKVVLT